VVRRRVLAEVDLEVGVDERGARERRAALNPTELVGAIRVEVPGIAPEEVEAAVRGDLVGQPADQATELQRRRRLAEAAADHAEDVAERVLRVGRADRTIERQRLPLDAREIAVVRENPGASPELTLERMRVLDAD